MRNKHKITTIVVASTICLIVIYLHLLSHDKTQQIYLNQTEKIIIDLKKDFLKDTVNNVLSEIDKLRETKYYNYNKNTESRLRRFEEGSALSDQKFVKYFIDTFENDLNPKMWNAFLWNNKTGEILYTRSDINSGSIEDMKDDLKDILSSYAEVEKGDIEGVFGVSEFYIDQLVKQEISEIIKNREFSSGSYIWVNEVINYEGGKNYAIRKVHPNLTETEDEYLSTDMEDIKGNLPYLEELEGINKDGELFFKYYFKKLKSSYVSEKIAYAKLYKDYDWIIAMGVHLDDIDDYTQQTSNEIYSLSTESIIRVLRYIFIVLLLGFITLYLMEKKHLLNSTELLESQVNLDVLTKAYSRRAGQKKLNKLFKEYKSNCSSPAIMMFDIDNFKNINDQYGHHSGDRVLIEVVKNINHLIRSSDYLIRWGGDEFVGIFLGLKEEHAIEYGQKILDSISALDIKLEENIIINITVSIGFSYFKDIDNDYNHVLKRADEAMYKSKQEGKNKVNSNL
nr:sensor domain-containing diguanylate cyclase [Tissierella sp.]